MPNRHIVEPPLEFQIEKPLFMVLIRSIGFRRGRGWDHEVWCDCDTIESNFWLHFEKLDRPAGARTLSDDVRPRAGAPGDGGRNWPGTCEYWIDPDAEVIDAGAFLSFWRQACVEAAVESALEAQSDHWS